MFRNVPGCSGMFHVPGFVDAPLNSHQKLAITKLIEGRKVFSLHRAPSRVNSNP